MMGISLGFYWKFCLGFFVPFALLGIFVFFIVTYEPLTYQVSYIILSMILAMNVISNFLRDMNIQKQLSMEDGF